MSDDDKNNGFPEDIWRQIMGEQSDDADFDQSDQESVDTEASSVESEEASQPSISAEETAVDSDDTSHQEEDDESSTGDASASSSEQEPVVAEESLLDHFESSDMQPAPDEDQAPVSSGVDQVLVDLNFRLKQQKIPLNQLSQLEPGFSFDLALDRAEPVTLEANGTAIARCELVEIGGRLGARIVKWLG